MSDAAQPQPTPVRTGAGGCIDPPRRRIDGRLVVASQALRRPVVLDEQSSVLYEALVDGRSVAEVVADTAAAAGVSESVVERFVDQLVRQLQPVGLDPTSDAPQDHPFVRSQVSPRIATPLLKGPHSSCGVSVGAGWVNLINRVDAQYPVDLGGRPSVDGAHADATELFLLGRVPLHGDAVLADHRGTRWLRCAPAERQTLVDALFAALEWEDDSAVSLRGSLIRCGDDLVLIDPMALDGLDQEATPSRLLANGLPIVGLVGTGRDIRYAALDGGGPDLAQLRAIVTLEPFGDGASAVSIVAGFLRDPTDLSQAEELVSRLPLVQVPAPDSVDELLGSIRSALDTEGEIKAPFATTSDGAGPPGGSTADPGTT